MQQNRGGGGAGGGGNGQDRRLKPPLVLQGAAHDQVNQQQQQQQQQLQQQAQKCPRCESLNTKFCYYNNYSLSQPRYFCKTCRRYWTQGGTLRNVPVGGGCRKGKRAKTASTSSSSLAENTSRTSRLLPQNLVTPLVQNPIIVSSTTSSLISSALRSPIFPSLATYNPVGIGVGDVGGGFLTSLAAIHQQSLSNQPPQPQLSFAHQSMSNLGANLGVGSSSNLGQLILHGFPSLISQQQQQQQQQQQRQQLYNLGGVGDDHTHRDHNQFYPHDQESLINQSSTTALASSHHHQQQQNWNHQANFVRNTTNSTNPIVSSDHTTLWSTISTSIKTGDTSTTTSAATTTYGGSSLNPGPWQHDHHLSGCGPPS